MTPFEFLPLPGDPTKEEQLQHAEKEQKERLEAAYEALQEYKRMHINV